MLEISTYDHPYQGSVCLVIDVPAGSPWGEGPFEDSPYGRITRAVAMIEEKIAEKESELSAILAGMDLISPTCLGPLDFSQEYQTFHLQLEVSCYSISSVSCVSNESVRKITETAQDEGVQIVGWQSVATDTAWVPAPAREVR